MNCIGARNQGDCCDTRFICTDSIFEQHSDKCHYKGKLYDYNEKIDASLLPSCVKEAKCVTSSNGPTFEFVHGDPVPVESGCLHKYTFRNMCNPSENVCDPVEKEKLIKCHQNGIVHHEGELFTPTFSSYFSSACYQCICDVNFDNNTAPAFNQNCRKLKCGIDLTYIEKLRNGCVPVYHTKNSDDAEPTKCCPIDFVCRKSINQITCNFFPC